MTIDEDMLIGEISHDDACFGIRAKAPGTRESVTRKLRYLPLTHPLRTKYQSSYMEFVAAAHLIETLTCQSLDNFLRERIWAPLGMQNIHYGRDDLHARGGVDDLAQGYGWDDQKNKYFSIPWSK